MCQQNGDNNVREFDSLEAGNGFLKGHSDARWGESAHPHAHWMSADGQMMVTPNPDTENSTLYKFTSHHGKTAPVGHFPIATGMMPDSSKYYVANFLDSTLSVIGIAGRLMGTTDLLKKLSTHPTYLWRNVRSRSADRPPVRSNRRLAHSNPGESGRQICDHGERLDLHDPCHRYED